MLAILLGGGVALLFSLLGTRVAINLFTQWGYGQEIRDDGPTSHHTKRGTPSMGGVAIVAGLWAGYLGAHLVGLAFDGAGISASGLLVLGLATGFLLLEVRPACT
jgi:phospho-N-acetylmuramoyl-pentapeptide-transferase